MSLLTVFTVHGCSSAGKLKLYADGTGRVTGQVSNKQNRSYVLDFDFYFSNPATLTEALTGQDMGPGPKQELQPILYVNAFHFVDC